MCVVVAEEKDVVCQCYAADAMKTTVKAMVMTTWDHPVFMLNCLTYLTNMLGLYVCAADKHAELDGVVKTCVLRLIRGYVCGPFCHISCRIPL